MTTKNINMDSIILSSGVRFGTSGVRGLVRSMSDEVCYAYTTAFLQALVSSVGKVVLGHDLRPSSPRIAAACASAITDAGGEVIYAGALPTPALAYYAKFINAPAIIVTGSHIPFDRNGIKFYRAEGEISKRDEYAIEHAEFQILDQQITAQLPVLDRNVEVHYVKRYTDFIGSNYLKGFRVAIYEHSSVARDLLATILKELGVDVITLGRTDSFVPIDTEAVRPEDVVKALSWAQEFKFDAIFSTDGDADRPLIGDESGQWLRGDVVGILCAKFLEADVIVTPVSSSTLAEKSNWFAEVIRTRIGSPYVIAAMEQAQINTTDIVVGFEANGGFLLGSNISRNQKKLSSLPTRDAILPILALLCLAKERNCKLSELTADLPSRATYSDRLQNFQTEKSIALLFSLQQDHQKTSQLIAPNSGEIASVNLTDGFRATFINGDIVHLRPSGNAPELRCYAESDTPANAHLLCNHCLISVKNILNN